MAWPAFGVAKVGDGPAAVLTKVVIRSPPRRWEHRASRSARRREACLHRGDTPGRRLCQILAHSGSRPRVELRVVGFPGRDCAAQTKAGVQSLHLGDRVAQGCSGRTRPLDDRVNVPLLDRVRVLATHAYRQPHGSRPQSSASLLWPQFRPRWLSPSRRPRENRMRLPPGDSSALRCRSAGCASPGARTRVVQRAHSATAQRVYVARAPSPAPWSNRFQSRFRGSLSREVANRCRSSGTLSFLSRRTRSGGCCREGGLLVGEHFFQSVTKSDQGVALVFCTPACRARRRRRPKHR
jgi:hypothetical protein